ncbi:Glycosyltransferase involved in cell wall bisynthesis [Thermanaeromonas toyohensis ToBE]|uniref:Glycosyltransferase involved in cell wall bisynthesis n=1 Tax=Thermanaeromonas toyohensis ToBE TaxID=698762 RepID=A0A1W1VXZ3_9FIRM|nr:glycosyltransferase family 4 protein [Thermanaeromonas toyohensis]SMB98225.1 Glycosyltransferase involved in cell wall bisynthesis [Thermanaeromonas toyohensis ToBE]
MRVALIYLGRLGGGAVYSLEVARVLAKKCDLTAFISEQVENLNAWEESGIKVITVPTYRNMGEFFLSTLFFYRWWRIALKIKQLKPEVLYYPMIHLWTPLINSFFPRIPKVVTLHDPVLHLGERDLFRRLVQIASIRQATRLIILSRVFENNLVGKGIPRNKIDIIHHGVFSYYLRWKKGVKPSSREKTILFFGRIIPYKGLDVLLRAFPKIKEKVPEARLIIAGSGELKPYAQLLEGLNNIEVVNRWIAEEEVAGFFERASLVVLPYKEATQSGVIPIAYSFGLPVVATKTGGLGEQVIHGNTGYLVPPSEPDALAEACIRLLEDEALAREMGTAGYQKAMEEWNWDIVAERVYHSCVKAKDLVLSSD